MSNQNKIIKEGLRRGDLEDTIYPIFEIDTFRSKMGEDKDVCVLTFQAKDRYPAKDMMEFIEKGYPFVLDADVSAGENEEGEYSIFVEVERSSKIADHITEMLFGISKIANIDDWKFTYYKDKKKREATKENLKEIVPSSSKIYEQKMQKFRTDEVKSFFSKTLMDDLVLENNKIKILKPFDVSVEFEIVREGDSKLIEGLEDMQVDDNSTAEIFWLTKVMGDYNITKFGDNFLFTNDTKSMVLKRI
jgi:hypothetical protein